MHHLVLFFDAWTAKHPKVKDVALVRREVGRPFYKS